MKWNDVERKKRETRDLNARDKEKYELHYKRWWCSVWNGSKKIKFQFPWSRQAVKTLKSNIVGVSSASKIEKEILKISGCKLKK